ncbi:MAG: hypothetical protein JO061_12435 [Acidobacteriaceae bacterium]|nr:hypothetical protein [Acidobacteriaceae bacterium]
MVAFAAWTVPLNFPLLDGFKTAIRPYMLFTGLFQAWNMFAPDPMRLNGYVEAEVTMQDGEKITWKAPRIEKLGIVQKYFRERYRKFMNEHLRMDAESLLWPDAAKHIARLYATDKSNPPINIVLIRYWSEVQPPGPHGEFSATPWTHFAYFSYDVKPEDLE